MKTGIDWTQTTVIACAMLRAEVSCVLQRAGLSPPVHWVQESLHEHPALLREELGRLLAQADDSAHILLVFNWCGGALEGLCAGKATLVVPRFHDCIRMLHAGSAGPLQTNSLYFTYGWVVSDGFLSKQCRRFAQKHGQEKARKAYRRMLREYQAITVVDTAAPYQQQAECQAELGRFAQQMNLAVKHSTGSLSVLEKLFCGQWDHDFLVVPPGRACTFDAFL